MRSLGAVTLLAGIGVALFFYLPAPVDRGTSLDKLQRVAAPRDLQSSPTHFTPVARLGAFSPSITLTRPARHETVNYASIETTQTPPPTAATAPASPSETQLGWQTVVSTAPATTSTVLPKTLSPTDPDARYKLVLDIQQQLRRAGCYWGRIDGSWGYATKDAMKEFTNRVNAALPIDQPDFVQLALIQSHGEKTCGACPAGQSLSASGRCVGLPMTAQAKQPEVLPWKATPGLGAAGEQPLFKPVPTTVISTEPLPDRMAIGGPVPTSVEAQQSTPPVTPGAAAAPPGTATAAVDPNVAAVKPPETAAPKAERHARPEGRGHFAGDYRHGGPGTPRYNLLLSLGGLY